MSDSVALPSVWDPIDVSTQDVQVRELGPLILSVSRTQGEWNVGRSYAASARFRGTGSYHEEDRIRFVADSAASDHVMLAPALAQRAIVARPDVPVWVLAGAETRFFVSTPLWVRLGVGPGGKLLHEVPSVPLNDTWFGQNTRVGELCFASRTAARVNMDAALRSPVRAITVVSIANRSEKHMQVQRLKIPVPHLNLYVHNNDAFFTQEIHVVHTAEGQTGAAKIRALPAEASGAVIVTPARQSEDRGGMFGTLGGLLG